MAKTRCTHTREDGTPCKNWALIGSDRCRWHGEERKERVRQPDDTEEELTLGNFLLEAEDDLAQRIQAAMERGRTDEEWLPHLQNALDNLPREGERRRVLRWVLGCQPGGEHAALTALIDELKAATMRLEASGLPQEERVLPKELFAPIAAAIALLESPGSLGPVGPSRERTPVPDRLPQATFQELKAMARAVNDGRTGRCWRPLDGETALLHEIAGQPHQTKLTSGEFLNWWGLPANLDSLRSELGKLEFSAVMLLHVSLGMALQRPGHVTVGIADLLRAIGWEPRSASKHAEMRSKIWHWLMMFDSMKVIGRRPGRYLDPATKKPLDLLSVDALLRVTGRRLPAQLALDGSAPPLEVSLVAGPWLDQFRGNRQVLTDYGDVLKIAAIPAGKPSGAWAQSIGLALQQRWRERASRAEERPAAGATHQPLRFKPFTRRDLLGLFPCEPYVEEILRSSNPKRARTYFREAIKLLKDAGVIGYYPEAQDDEKRQAWNRKGWEDAWLDQPLDIQPAGERLAAAVEIARSGANARKKRRKKPSRSLE